MFAVVLDFTDFVIIGAAKVAVLSGLFVYLKPRDRARLFRVEAKLDLLLKHAGIAYDPKAAVQPSVQDALQRGNKIEAIQLYRDATGVGLAEAKKDVEAIQISLKT